MQHAPVLSLGEEEPAGAEHHPDDVEKEELAEGDQDCLVEPAVEEAVAPMPLAFSLGRRVKHPEYSQSEDRDQEPHIDRVRATPTYQSLQVLP